ncbi:MAG: hypothetical protein LUD27_07775 [Clostridia bacterium]|nr:hypothetical protein [Clostridia bacterium]
MGTNNEALAECLELSRWICQMGLGINSKRAACEIYSQLVESSANLGAMITAADYVPTRSQRSESSVEGMKEISKVIYLLNVANDSGLFVKSAVSNAIACAIRVSSLLNGVAAAYMNASIVSKTVDIEDEAATVSYKNDDPDGFNDPYTV